MSIERKDLDGLIAAAAAAAANSWSPYSRFPVGAAIQCTDGTVVTGTNVENRSYGLTICAERSAAVTAVSQGKRDWEAVAICCPSSEEPVSPCGACRQFLSEFASPGTTVVYVGRDRSRRVVTTIGALLPADALQHLKDRP